MLQALFQSLQKGRQLIGDTGNFGFRAKSVAQGRGILREEYILHLVNGDIEQLRSELNKEEKLSVYLNDFGRCISSRYDENLLFSLQP